MQRLRLRANGHVPNMCLGRVEGPFATQLRPIQRKATLSVNPIVHDSD